MIGYVALYDCIHHSLKEVDGNIYASSLDCMEIAWDYCHERNKVAGFKLYKPDIMTIDEWIKNCTEK